MSDRVRTEEVSVRVYETLRDCGAVGVNYDKGLAALAIVQHTLMQSVLQRAALVEEARSKEEHDDL